MTPIPISSSLLISLPSSHVGAVGGTGHLGRGVRVLARSVRAGLVFLAEGGAERLAAGAVSHGGLARRRGAHGLEAVVSFTRLIGSSSPVSLFPCVVGPPPSLCRVSGCGGCLVVSRSISRHGRRQPQPGLFCRTVSIDALDDPHSVHPLPCLRSADAINKVRPEGRGRGGAIKKENGPPKFSRSPGEGRACNAM